MTPQDLLLLIDYNKETLPRPHYVNKPMMTAALQLERLK